MIKLINCKDCKMEYRLVDGNCSNCSYIVPDDLIEVYKLISNLNYGLTYQISKNRMSTKEFIKEFKKNNV